MIAGFAYDLKHAARGLLRRPGFAVSATLVLALGIGATTGMFSVAYGVLLRALPYEEPERLVSLWPEVQVNKMIADRATDLESFDAVAADILGLFSLTGDGEPLMVEGGSVGHAFFEVLGVEAALGRTFVPGENRPGSDHVVVLSHGLWSRRFGADPAIVGRSIDIGSEPHEIVGVMPESFRPPSASAEIWAPLTIDPADLEDYRGSFYISLIGRLAAGVERAQADGELRGLALAVREEHPNLMPDEKVEGAWVLPLHEHLVASVRPTLLVLVGAAFSLLLVAASNVAGLMVARASSRGREVAVRAALGARAGRLFRQLIAESLLLACVGALAGLLLTAWVTEILMRFLPEEIPGTAVIAIDAPVLVFCISVSLTAALFASAAPLRWSTRTEASRALRGGAATDGAGRGRARGGLVVAQVAVATVLLMAAGLFLRSLDRLTDVDPGFSPDSLLTLRVSPSSVRYPDDVTRLEYFGRVLDQVRGIPAVAEAGLVQVVPLTPYRWVLPYLAEDHPVAPNTPPGTPLPDAELRVVAPGYFRSLEVPILAGRLFDARDTQGGTAAGIINRTLAEALWPDGNAVGKKVRHFGDGGPEFTVVGVVEDVHQLRLDQSPRPEIFRPFEQWPLVSMYLTVRASVEPTSLVPELRQAIWKVDRDVPLSEIRSGATLVRGVTGDERLISSVVSLFAAVALVLGMVGVFAVVSFSVACRNRELGIRVALGAQRGTVIGTVLRQGLKLTGAGLGLGLLGAVASGQILESRLFEVGTLDGPTLLAVAAVLAVAALASTGLPAVRAGAIDPVRVIQGD